MISGVQIRSASPAETMSIGRSLGRLLQAGDVVCLSGDLGAGKTCMARGICEGLGVDPCDVSSPTFVLAQEYRGRVPVYHLDLYRLGSSDEVEEAGLDDYLRGDGVALIEWPEVYPPISLYGRISVDIRYLADGDSRLLEFAAYGERSRSILEEMSLC